MQISHPSHHRWQRAVSSNALDHFSPRTAGKIRTALAESTAAGIRYTIEPLSEAFLDAFMPLYTDHIGAKKNALLHDVFAKTLGKEASSFPYYALSLYERDLFIGGTIFSLRPDKISFAYRTFNNSWRAANVKISPAYIGEFAIAEFAIAQGISTISHGKDRNPYGLNAAIGLAMFKLSAGCRPFLVPKATIHTIDTDTLTTDALILELPTVGTVITKAYLVTTPEHAPKYEQATKYPDLLTVEVLYRASEIS